MKSKNIDIHGKIARVFICDSLLMTPVVPVAYRAAADLMEAGHSLKDPFIQRDNNVIWIELDNRVISYIIYKQHQDGAKDCAYICMSWVDKEFRGQGIRSIIEETFVEELRLNNVKYIETETHVNNTAVDRSYEKLGYNKVYFRRFKKI